MDPLLEERGFIGPNDITSAEYAWEMRKTEYQQITTIFLQGENRLSKILLILTTVFMVAYTIRLTIMGRQDELELLKLVGATNNYIRTPFLLEGFLQGALGSTVGLASLYLLFQWITNRFTGQGFLNLIDFTFFPPATVIAIIGISILLCAVGSHTSMRRYLRI